jgi:hypothetical protein
MPVPTEADLYGEHQYLGRRRAHDRSEGNRRRWAGQHLNRGFHGTKSASPISNPGQDSQGGQGTGSVGGTPTNAELQITRAQVTGHCLVITARLPSSYTGLMTFTVTTRHGQRTIRLRRTVKMVGGVAHLIVALDANERSSDKLTLIVRYGGDRAHPAQTHRTTVPVPHARVHHTR